MCEGVLYRITEKEMDELDLSEGGRAYNIIHVSIAGDKCGKVIAQTFSSKAVAYGLLPSKRYVDILIDGAIEHDLSQAWIAHLRNTPQVDRSHVSYLQLYIRKFNRFVVRIGLPHPFRWWKKHHIKKTTKNFGVNSH